MGEGATGLVADKHPVMVAGRALSGQRRQWLLSHERGHVARVNDELGHAFEERAIVAESVRSAAAMRRPKKPLEQDDERQNWTEIAVAVATKREPRLGAGVLS